MNTYEKVKQWAKEHLADKDGIIRETIYADYRDEMDINDAVRILTSDVPMSTFYEWILEVYEEVAEDLTRENADKAWEALKGEPGIVRDEVLDAILEMTEIDREYPEDRFLHQEFKVPVMVDTGDAEHDFTLNDLPYFLEKDGAVPERAGLTWLAKQQGYTAENLAAAIREQRTAEGKFLSSVRREVDECPSGMPVLTFLTTMTMEELMSVNERLTEYIPDPEKRPDAGIITIPRNAFCGLYDPITGGGSLMEIELEKEVKLPVKYVWSCLPDTETHLCRWSVDTTYGFCGKAWTSRPQIT